MRPSTALDPIFSACRIPLSLFRASCLALLLVAGSAGAQEERVLTLVLEAPSYVSFQNQVQIPIPEGTRIRFRLGDPQSDGSIPFTVRPGDLAMRPVPIGRGARGAYRLAEETQGVMRRGADGFEIDFPAKIEAVTLLRDGTERTLTHQVQFTTAYASATDEKVERMIEVRGKRLRQTDRKVELVAALTNRTDATPAPGAATVAVLLGTFDRLPDRAGEPNGRR